MKVFEKIFKLKFQQESKRVLASWDQQGEDGKTEGKDVFQPFLVLWAAALSGVQPYVPKEDT